MTARRGRPWPQRGSKELWSESFRLIFRYLSAAPNISWTHAKEVSFTPGIANLGCDKSSGDLPGSRLDFHPGHPKRLMIFCFLSCCWK